MSTHYVAKYARFNFMPIVEVTNRIGRNVETVQQLDTLNHKVATVIKDITSVTLHTVVEGEALPNISYRYYSTTTLYWVLAMYNGIMNPLEIEAGDIILIPNLTTINQNISLANTVSKLGDIVQI